MLSSLTDLAVRLSDDMYIKVSNFIFKKKAKGYQIAFGFNQDMLNHPDQYSVQVVSENYHIPEVLNDIKVTIARTHSVACTI